MSPASDLFFYGVNLIRISYRGSNSDGSFKKDSVSREISVDNFEISVPEITYKNASFSEGVVSAELLNNTFERRAVKFICAGYDDKKLEFVETGDEIFINPGETKRVSYEFLNEKATEGKTIKVFLWDDYSGMKPLEREIR